MQLKVSDRNLNRLAIVMALTFMAMCVTSFVAMEINIATVKAYPDDDPDMSGTAKAGFNEATFKIPFAVTHCNLITGSYGEPIRTDCYRKVVWNYQAEGTVKEIVTTLSASRFTRQYDAPVNAATVEYIVRGPAMSQALISENPNNVLCNPKYSVTGILHMNIEDDPDDYSFARDQGPPAPEQ